MTLLSNHGELSTLFIEPLAYYTTEAAFGANLAPNLKAQHDKPRYFWQRHLKDDHGLYTVTFKLDKPSGPVTINWTSGGTAVEGTHWSTSESNSVTLRGGNTSFALPITIIDKGKWFFEKTLDIRITDITGAVLGEGANHCQIVIRPATAPPKISVTSTGGTVAASTNQTVTFTLSETALAGEEVKIYWKAIGDLASKITGSAQGSVVFPSGDTTSDIVVQHDGTGTVGDTAQIVADFESDQVAYQEDLWDTDTQAWVANARDIHVDENLWCHSTDLLGSGWEWPQITPDRPFIASRPRNTLPGGVNTTDDSLHIVIAGAQDTTSTPEVDPNTGNDLTAFVPAGNNGPGEMPYLRQSFFTVFGGGPNTGHVAKEWSRAVYRIAHWTGGESTNRHVELHRVGVRVRWQNRNHGASFRTDVKGGTPGLDRAGNTVAVFTDSQNVKHWFWQQHAGHPEDLKGVFEDDFGVGYYYIHKIDETHTYPSNSGIGAEVIGVDTLNPIEYPIWHDSIISDAGGDTPADIVAGGKGVLWHSIEFMQFDVQPGAPTTHWPKEGLWWSPRGNAVLNTAAPGNHTITAS